MHGKASEVLLTQQLYHLHNQWCSYTALHMSCLDARLYVVFIYKCV